MSARLIDLALAGLGVGVFAPVAAGIALAIVIDDGGPVLFRQERVGQGRRAFTVKKLRTMRDQQVTRVGRLLRETGLDEIAQFVSVLEGHMRVVGPRPLTPADVTRLGWDAPAFDVRFRVKPGITGLAQVFGGRTARHSFRFDRLYVERQSLRLDLFLVAVSFAMNVAGKKRVRRALRSTRQLRRRTPWRTSIPNSRFANA